MRKITRDNVSQCLRMAHNTRRKEGMSYQTGLWLGMAMGMAQSMDDTTNDQVQRISEYF